MPSFSTVAIRFSADLSSFSTGMQNATRQMDRAGKRMQRIGQSMSLAITGPLVGAGTLAVKTFADFEQELEKVEAVSGATSSQISQLRENAEALGASTRFAASEVATLQLNLSKLGFSPDEILQSTEAILQLSLASGEDLAQSATVAASTLRGFGLEASETQRIVDVMAKSFSSSALDLSKFETAMAIAAPVAKTARVSVEELTGQLSVLVNAGIDASTAGTGLRNILLDVASAGITVEEAFSQINTASDKNVAALNLFGKRGATVATVLADNVAQARSFTDEYEAAGGAASAMAKIMDDTTTGSFKKLQSATESAAIAIGQALSPTVRKLADRLSNLISEFKELSPQTQKTIVAVAAFAAAAGPAVIVLGTMQRNIATLLPLLGKLRIALLANPYTAVAAAIAAVGVALYSLNRNSEEAVRKTNALAQVRDKAAKSIAGERAKLEELLFIARDEQLSKERRLEAVRELNKLSPKYLGNLKLEKINTDASREAIEKYNESLLRSATIKAAQEKLQEIQSKIIDEEIRQSKARKTNQDDLNAALTGQKQLSQQQLELLKKLNDENSDLSKLSDKINQNKLSGLKAESQALLELIKNNELLKKSQNTDEPLDTSNGNGRASVSGVSSVETEGFVELSSPLEGLTATLPSQADLISRVLNSLNTDFERVQQIAVQVGDAVGNAFSQLGANISQGLGLAEDGFEGFVSNLVGTISKLISLMLSASISQAIAGATASGTATGPAAVFSTPAFIATAVGGVLSAFAAIPKFEYGGIVPGSAYSGDRMLARVNSGELILNAAQQSNLASKLSAQPSIAGGGKLYTEVSGRNLRIILDREDINSKRS